MKILLCTSLYKESTNEREKLCKNVLVKKSNFAINIEKPCQYCCNNGRAKVNHTIECCEVLKSKPYKERIEFLKGLQLCLGCLRKSSRQVLYYTTYMQSYELFQETSNCIAYHP